MNGGVRPIAKLTIKPMRRFNTGLLGGHSRDSAAACVHDFSKFSLCERQSIGFDPGSVAAVVFYLWRSWCRWSIIRGRSTDLY